MCLGAGARAANEQARRNYAYQLQQREQNWMQTLSITSTERIMHEQGVDASNIGVSQVLGDIEVVNDGGYFIHADLGGKRQWGPSGSRRSSYGWQQSTLKPVGYIV